jgi:hypothetical protein
VATCGGCGEEITDIVLRAFGMTWHPYHLSCNTCGNDFSDGSKVFEGEDNFAYCGNCFERAFSTICAGCDQVIDGELVNAINLTFHPNCFVCKTCKAPLSDSFFPVGDGTAYCEKHYYDAQGLLCRECEKPILVGKCVQFSQWKYHIEHFKCSFCKKPLAGLKFQAYREKPFCQTW